MPVRMRSVFARCPHPRASRGAGRPIDRGARLKAFPRGRRVARFRPTQKARGQTAQPRRIGCPPLRALAAPRTTTCVRAASPRRRRGPRKGRLGQRFRETYASTPGSWRPDPELALCESSRPRHLEAPRAKPARLRAERGGGSPRNSPPLVPRGRFRSGRPPTSAGVTKTRRLPRHACGVPRLSRFANGGAVCTRLLRPAIPANDVARPHQKATLPTQREAPQRAR